jgi:hypothetical protein
MSDPPDDTTAGKAPRYMRRLSDKILIAFHQACDQQDFELAERRSSQVGGISRLPRIGAAKRV